MFVRTLVHKQGGGRDPFNVKASSKAHSSDEVLFSPLLCDSMVHTSPTGALAGSSAAAMPAIQAPVLDPALALEDQRPGRDGNTILAVPGADIHSLQSVIRQRDVFFAQPATEVAIVYFHRSIF